MTQWQQAANDIARPEGGLRVVSASANETRLLGRCLGRLLRPGDVVLLWGPFGAGKTTLTKGIGRAMGVREQITSPSFTLVNEYRGAKGTLLCHVDLYRLGDQREVYGLGLEEYLSGAAICVIEWPEAAEGTLPPERLDIKMSFLGENGRLLHLAGVGPRHFDVARQFSAKCLPITLPKSGQRDGEGKQARKTS